jgi:amino acid adenylation domain-containing protein
VRELCALSLRGHRELEKCPYWRTWSPVTSKPRHVYPAVMPRVPSEQDASRGIGELIIKSAIGARQHPAIRILTDSDRPDVVSTYEALLDEAAAIAVGLRAMGAREQRVMLVLPPGPSYVATLLGCLLSGSVCVPAYPPRFNHRLTRLETVARDSQAVFAVGSEPVIRQIHRRDHETPAMAALHWIDSNELKSTATSLQDWRTDVDPDSLAIIQYTSGSTSEPKGVLLSHAGLARHCVQLIAQGEFGPEDRWASWLPPYHDMGLIGALLVPLCLGVETVVMSPFSFLQRPVRWLEAISRYRVTVSGGPNFGYELCARRVRDEQRESLDLGSWRYACCGAERVRPETLERFARRFEVSGFRASAFVPSYGLAEAVLAISTGKAGSVPREFSADAAALGHGRALRATSSDRRIRLISCGTPLPGLDVVIVDPVTFAHKADGEIGEIWASGESMAHGYWNRTDLTEAIFGARLAGCNRRYLRTGDLGFLDCGELFITGRSKDLIILGGTNYYPEDIEAAVVACHPSVQLGGAAAFAIERNNDERLVVVQEIEPKAVSLAAAIVDAIRDAVHDSHKIPVEDVVLVAPGTIPKTSSGKVQRSRCRELYVGGELKRLDTPSKEDLELVTAELADYESQVISILSDLLGVAEVGADESFFDLGGHSLLAMQLASRLRDRFGVDVPLNQLFKSPTARQLARLLAMGERVGTAAPASSDTQQSGPVLSLSQERMWFLHQLEPESAAYNVAGAIKINGHLDHHAFSRAFNAVLTRHSTLRANFALENGVPAPRLNAAAELKIPLIDVSRAAEPESLAIAGASRLAALPFDIERQLLVRVELYRISTKCHIVAASMQHLVTDAWSMGLILADVLKFYHAMVRNETVPPTEPGTNHQDYARWQRVALDDKVLRTELAFWKAELCGVQPLQLPFDRRRAVARTSRGSFVPLPLPGELMASLREFAAAHDATLFMVMLAAFDILLYRYCGQTDIVVGVPVANRTRSSSEAFVGTLVNTLAIRARLDAQMSFAGLLRRVRDTSIQCFMHQEVPFERVVSELGLERYPGTPPLVQVMFDFQNTPMPLGASGALTLQQVPISRGAAQFDLSLLVFDTALGQSVGLEFRNAVFDEATIRRLGEHYRAILEQILADPLQSIEHLDLLSPGENDEIAQLCRAPRREPQGRAPLLARLHELAESQPEASAVAGVLESLTYRQLADRTESLAGRLSALGLGAGKRSGVLLERGASLVVAILAVLRCGAAYVPLDPRHPRARIAYVLSDCSLELVITQESLVPLLPATAPPTQVVCLDRPMTRHAAAQLPRLASNDNDTAYVLYTSGSTGKPKGVEVSIGALENFLNSMLNCPGMQKHEVLLSITTVAFDIAGLELLLPILAGGTVFIAPSRVITDGRALIDVVSKVRPTLMQGTPATWTMLLEAGFQGAPGLRILCGGETLTQDLAERLLPRCSELWNMYGPTETTIWSSLHRVQASGDPIPIGRPIDETSIYVLDHLGRLCPRGVVGEIFIGGKGVAKGYWNRPELTSACFLHDPFERSGAGRMYRTGDLGRLRGDSLFEHWGRVDYQVKVRGFRIEPAEVETAIRAVTGLHEVLVIAREFRANDVRLVAYLVADGTGFAGDIRQQLRENLPDYMIPSAFVRLNAFPRTPNGKIDRAALPVPDVSHTQPAADRVAPRTDLERRLAPLFSEVLGTDAIGVHDDFFSLGGHSLLAVRLVAQVEREFGVRLPLAALFEASTPAALAQRIERQQTSDDKPHSLAISLPSYGLSAVAGYTHLALIQQGKSRLPLYCVHGASGHVLNFAPLARRLGNSRPIFGLQARGIDGVSPPVTRLQEAARDYVQEVRRIQPRGPYFFVGYCVGGLIALEMARIVESLGDRVALVALINTYYPALAIPNHRFRRFVGKLRSGGASFGLSWFRAKCSYLFSELAQSLCIGWHRLFGRAVPPALRDSWLTHRFISALRKYRAMPYAGQLAVLRATDDPTLAAVGSDLGWRLAAEGALIVRDVPGDHASVMHEPNVDVLSRALEESVASAEQTQPAGEIGGRPNTMR